MDNRRAPRSAGDGSPSSRVMPISTSPIKDGDGESTPVREIEVEHRQLPGYERSAGVGFPASRVKPISTSPIETGDTPMKIERALPLETGEPGNTTLNDKQ